MRGENMIFNRHGPAKPCISGKGIEMHAPTYDQVALKISTKSNVITSLCNSLIYSLSKTQVTFKVIHLIYTSKRLLHYLNKMEAEVCVNCTTEDCSLPTVKDSLLGVADSINTIIEKQKKHNYPSFILNLQQNLVDDFEDKIESYMIAADEEIKNLTLDITNRIDKGHGISANKSS